MDITQNGTIAVRSQCSDDLAVIARALPSDNQDAHDKACRVVAYITALERVIDAHKLWGDVR